MVHGVYKEFGSGNEECGKIKIITTEAQTCPPSQALLILTKKVDKWRYRIGAWRFFYEIDEEQKIIYMLAAAHRSSAYQH